MQAHSMCRSRPYKHFLDVGCYMWRQPAKDGNEEFLVEG
jgi:hypothetical protein